MRIAIYANPVSPFGTAFVKSIIEHCCKEIEMVVFPAFSLWWEFRCRLKKQPFLKPTPAYRKYFEQEIATLASWVRKQNHHVHIRSVDDVNNEEESEIASAYDLILSAAFPQIFKRMFFLSPKFPVVNFHPSYLPRCQGAHPVYWTIATGEPYGGVSSHFVTEKIDRGPIIYREKIFFNKDTIVYSELYAAVINALPSVIMGTLSKINARKLVGQVNEKAVFYTEDQPTDHEIKSAMKTSIISAKIRAGKAFMYCNELRIDLFPPVERSLVENTEEYKTLQYLSNEQVKIKGADGVVVVNVKLDSSSIWRRILAKGKQLGLPFFFYLLDLYNERVIFRNSL